MLYLNTNVVVFQSRRGRSQSSSPIIKPRQLESVRAHRSLCCKGVLLGLNNFGRKDDGRWIVTIYSVLL
jgi:hypothetical protein